MEAIRKIILNQEDITMAKQYNTVIKTDYVGTSIQPQFCPIPKPIYDTQQWSFRLDLVTNFYVEKDTLKEINKGDIVMNVMYEGIVRCQYDPILIQMLDLAINRK